MTQEQIAELIAENAKLKQQLTKPAKIAGKLSLKVSAEKKCLSIYGISTRGAHLYAGQWLRILDAAPDIRAFIEANKDQLAWKTEEPN